MSEQDRSGPPENANDSAQRGTTAKVNSDLRDPAPQRLIPRRRRGPKLLRAALAGGIVLLAVAGFFLWRYLSSYQSTDDAQVDAHLYPVSARFCSTSATAESARARVDATCCGPVPAVRRFAWAWVSRDLACAIAC